MRSRRPPQPSRLAPLRAAWPRARRLKTTPASLAHASEPGVLSPQGRRRRTPDADPLSRTGARQSTSRSPTGLPAPMPRARRAESAYVPPAARRRRTIGSDWRRCTPSASPSRPATPRQPIESSLAVSPTSRSSHGRVLSGPRATTFQQWDWFREAGQPGPQRRHSPVPAQAAAPHRSSLRQPPMAPSPRTPWGQGGCSPCYAASRQRHPPTRTGHPKAQRSQLRDGPAPGVAPLGNCPQPSGSWPLAQRPP